MKNGAIVILLALGVLVNDFDHPASAQNAIGGPKKQTSVGGAAKQSSPVVPANKGGSISVSQPSQRTSVGGAAKQSSPVVPANKGGSISISQPSHPKCPPGTCVAKKN